MKSSNVEHKTILIVDDDDLNRKLFSALLAARGYRIVQAADGPRAIDLAHQELPDLVIMDVQMPGISGIEATKALKSDHYSRDRSDGISDRRRRTSSERV